MTAAGAGVRGLDCPIFRQRITEVLSRGNLAREGSYRYYRQRLEKLEAAPKEFFGFKFIA